MHVEDPVQDTGKQYVFQYFETKATVDKVVHTLLETQPKMRHHLLRAIAFPRWRIALVKMQRVAQSERLTRKFTAQPSERCQQTEGIRHASGREAMRFANRNYVPKSVCTRLWRTGFLLSPVSWAYGPWWPGSHQKIATIQRWKDESETPPHRTTWTAMFEGMPMLRRNVCIKNICSQRVANDGRTPHFSLLANCPAMPT